MNKEWITVKDLANIQGITPRAVRKAVNKNKYITRLVDGSTGTKYEILVQSLNYDTQNLIDFENYKKNIEKSGLSAESSRFANSKPELVYRRQPSDKEPILKKRMRFRLMHYKLLLHDMI